MACGSADGGENLADLCRFMHQAHTVRTENMVQYIPFIYKKDKWECMEVTEMCTSRQRRLFYLEYRMVHLQRMPIYKPMLS